MRVAARTSSLRLQGQGHRHPPDRPGARRAHGARGERPAVGPAPADHRAADRRRERLSTLVGALRPRDGGRLRGPGRDRAGDRQHPPRAPGGIGRRSRGGSPDARRRGLQLLPEGPLLPEPAAPEAGDQGARGRDRAGPPLRRGLRGPRRRLLLLGFLWRHFDLGGLRARPPCRREGPGADAGRAGSASRVRPDRALLRLGHGPRGARDSRGHREEPEVERRLLLAGPVPGHAGPVRRGLRGDAARHLPGSAQREPAVPAGLVLHVPAPVRGGRARR